MSLHLEHLAIKIIDKRKASKKKTELTPAVKLENGSLSRERLTPQRKPRRRATHSSRKLYVPDIDERKGPPLTAQNFATDGVILTGIYGNDSTVTFEGIEGTGKPQWVSFYYQSKQP